jgi:hypothetical protein
VPSRFARRRAGFGYDAIAGVLLHRTTVSALRS